MLLSLQQPPEAFFTDPLPQPRTLTPSPRRSLLPFLLPTAATLSLPLSSLPRRRRLPSPPSPLPAAAPPTLRSRLQLSRDPDRQQATERTRRVGGGSGDG